MFYTHIATKLHLANRWRKEDRKALRPAKSERDRECLSFSKRSYGLDTSVCVCANDVCTTSGMPVYALSLCVTTGLLLTNGI